MNIGKPVKKLDEPVGWIMSGRNHRRKVRSLCILAVGAVALLSCSRANRLGAQTSEGETVWRVAAGDDLQKYLDQAKQGDTIILEAGTVFRGNFTLRAKLGSGVITIKGSAEDQLPAANRRVEPALHAASMPKLITPSTVSVITSENSAHEYRFLGIEFGVAEGVYVNDLIRLNYTGNTVELLPWGIEFDRCYIHGDPVKGGKRGIAMNSAYTVVKNSDIRDFIGIGQDSQTICSWSGTGPFLILNNHLEAAGENVMFGGSFPIIPYLVPSDIQIYGNHFYKPLAWKGKYAVKNLIELKAGRNVDIQYNVFENVWVSAQNGFAIAFTVRSCETGDHFWTIVKDVNFSNNVVLNAEGGGVKILGMDDLRQRCLTPAAGTVTTTVTAVSGQGTHFLMDFDGDRKISVNNTLRKVVKIIDDRNLVVDTPFPVDITQPVTFAYNIPEAGLASDIVIRNNLFDKIHPPDGSASGWLFFLANGPEDITIENNTGFPGAAVMLLDVKPSRHIIYRYNISSHGTLGFRGSGKQIGQATIDAYMLDSTVAGNVMTGAGAWGKLYPPGNFFPETIESVGFSDPATRDYSLVPASSFRGKGSNGRDPGADMSILKQVMQIVPTGQNIFDAGVGLAPQ